MRHLKKRILEFFQGFKQCGRKLKKKENFGNFYFSWYKSISRVTAIFNHLLIDTFLKYTIFFVNVNIFSTIAINETHLFIRFFD